jgi:hypothetical protein
LGSFRQFVWVPFVWVHFVWVHCRLGSVRLGSLVVVQVHCRFGFIVDWVHSLGLLLLGFIVALGSLSSDWVHFRHFIVYSLHSFSSCSSPCNLLPLLIVTSSQMIDCCVHSIVICLVRF